MVLPIPEERDPKCPHKTSTRARQRLAGLVRPRNGREFRLDVDRGRDDIVRLILRDRALVFDRVVLCRVEWFLRRVGAAVERPHGRRRIASGEERGPVRVAHARQGSEFCGSSGILYHMRGVVSEKALTVRFPPVAIAHFHRSPAYTADADI